MYQVTYKNTYPEDYTYSNINGFDLLNEFGR